MVDDKESSAHEDRRRNGMRAGGSPSIVYGMALVGALVYHVQHTTSFWSVVLGILKAIVWPALLIYKLLEFLNM